MTDQTTAQTGTGTEAAATTQAAATTETAAAAATTATTGTTTQATAAAGTLLTGADKGDAVVQVAPADFPNDWREKLAGGDAKALEQLKRYGSPADVWTKTRSLEQKLSSGDYKRDLPKDATPEQVAEWRKEHGVPLDPAGYKIELGNGLVLGEADKPLIDSFTKTAHGKNWDNAKVNDALNWYYGEQDRLKAERDASDLEYRAQNEDALRAKFGPEYRPRLTAATNLLSSLPSHFHVEKDGKVIPGAILAEARLPDGTKLGDNAAWLAWLSGISTELNPAATLIPALSDSGKSVEGRIGELKTLMKDRQSEYYKGPNSNKLQAEYRTLLDQQSKHKSQAA